MALVIIIQSARKQLAYVENDVEITLISRTHFESQEPL